MKDVLKLEQSKSDPCIFYKNIQGKVVLMLGVYIDDTMVYGIKTETAWYVEPRRKAHGQTR
jgi:hypothetical protein